MARSHCVYVVLSSNFSVPLAGFTVKHELVTWLVRHPEVTDVTEVVWRCGDGLSQEAPRPLLIADLKQ